MKPTKEQQLMADAFFKKYLPFQQVPRFPEDGQDYSGITTVEARNYAYLFVRSIFSEKPEISWKEFESQLLYRIRVLHKLSDSLGQSIKRMGFDERWFARECVTDYFDYSSELKLPFKEQVKSFRLTAKLIPAWLKAKPQKTGNFIVSHSLLEHPEATLIIKITNLEGERVATVGGYLYYEAGQPTIRITNVQGKKTMQKPEETEKRFKERAKKHPEQYAQLSRELGENWRVFFVKEIISAAKQKGIKVVGELPRKYYALLTPLAQEREYKRQVRQSKQTYRKAGLTEQPDKTWRFEPIRRVHRRV